jgi:hypothetical protein
MFPTPAEALAMARQVTDLLNIDHFSETTQLSVDKADVYGLRVEGRGWYVKLYIDDEVPEVTFISLHRLEHPIETNGGRIEP